jgi:hypothetical protein
MNRSPIAMTVALALILLLAACSGRDSPPQPDQMPLALVSDIFQSGYELAGYHEQDLNGDGSTEALAVLTQKLPADLSFVSSSYVLLFDQRAEAWGLVDGRQMDGGYAATELHDLTGDGIPELVVSTERVSVERGDFVTPQRTTGYLAIFEVGQEEQLIELGMFSSSLSGAGHTYPKTSRWEGRSAIQTAHDLPTAESPLWQPYQVETLAWDGQQFAQTQVRERRRISPLISWVVSRNAPWLAAFLALGSLLSWGALVVARRTQVEERWAFLGAAVLLIAGGIGLGLVREWLCVPAPILAGLAGLLIVRRVAIRQGAGSKRDGR